MSKNKRYSGRTQKNHSRRVTKSLELRRKKLLTNKLTKNTKHVLSDLILKDNRPKQITPTDHTKKYLKN